MNTEQQISDTAKLARLEKVVSVFLVDIGYQNWRETVDRVQAGYTIENDKQCIYDLGTMNFHWLAQKFDDIRGDAASKSPAVSPTVATVAEPVVAPQPPEWVPIDKIYLRSGELYEVTFADGSVGCRELRYIDKSVCLAARRYVPYNPKPYKASPKPAEVIKDVAADMKAAVTGRQDYISAGDVRRWIKDLESATS